MNDRADAVRSDDGPDEECNTSTRHEVCFDGEKMPDFVDWEPDRRQRAQPEQEERHKVTRVRTGRLRHGVLAAVRAVLIPAWPDSLDHQINAGASVVLSACITLEGRCYTPNPRLDAIPHASHGSSIEDRPQRSPDTERAPAHDWKRDVVCCTDASSHAEQASGDSIADPDTKPGLPPGQAVQNVGRGDHPCVDVEGVGDPKSYKVPRTPLTTLRLDGLEIVIRQH